MRIVLTKSQWERISNILDGLSLVSVASVILPALFDKPNLPGVILGSVATICFWVASIWVARKY